MLLNVAFCNGSEASLHLSKDDISYIRCEYSQYRIVRLHFPITTYSTPHLSYREQAVDFYAEHQSKSFFK